MNIGIIGLGLIGGSLAKAYKAAGHTIYARETDERTLDLAIRSGAVDAPLDDGALNHCELILIAVYPRAAIAFLDEAAHHIRPEATVIDCCGTKKNVCAAGFEAASRFGFSFVGGHPMAGTEQSGFEHSKASMFQGASMIIVPPVYDDALLLKKIERLLAPIEFGRLTVTTAEKHDAMIAFTSQMAHLVSNAFIKSPVMRNHEGFSAGSYRDLTRVAWLNEQMWTELFMENRTFLLGELDCFLNALQVYRDALQNEDFDRLKAALSEGKRLKEEIDRKNRDH